MNRSGVALIYSMIDGMESRYVETNGIRLHLMQGGEGKQTMLLLHGFPEFWYSWRRVTGAFESHFRICAPDLRGYNLSDKPQGVDQYGMRHLVADIAGLVAALGGEPVHLIAHDWGGAAAWVFAAFHPQSVRKLVMINSPHPSTFTRDILTNPAQQQASQYIHYLRQPKAEQLLAANGFERLKRMLEIPPTWTAEEVHAYEEAWSQPGALTAMLNYYRAITVLPPDFHLGEQPRTVAPAGARIPNVPISVPTLVVWGDRDHALKPSLVDGLEQYVPDLRVHHIPNATHWVQHDAPAELIEVISEYLS